MPPTKGNVRTASAEVDDVGWCTSCMTTKNQAPVTTQVAMTLTDIARVNAVPAIFRATAEIIVNHRRWALHQTKRNIAPKSSWKGLSKLAQSAKVRTSTPVPGIQMLMARHLSLATEPTF